VYCETGSARQVEFERARAEFEAVTGQVEDRGAVLETRAGHSYGYLGMLAGHSYGYLGTLARLQNDNQAAISMYLKAVDLAAPSQRISYYRRLAQVYCDEGKAVEAARAYRDAIDLARLHGYARDVEDLAEQQAKDCQ
jgi:tetratricopeptide (TPR) repeat protein